MPKNNGKRSENGLIIEGERPKIELTVDEFNVEAKMTIDFSETLWSLEKLISMNLTTLNEYKEELLMNITYNCEIDEENSDYTPEL